MTAVSGWVVVWYRSDMGCRSAARLAAQLALAGPEAAGRSEGVERLEPD